MGSSQGMGWGRGAGRAATLAVGASRLSAWVHAGTALLASFALAADPPAGRGPVTAAPAPVPAQIEITADRLDYDRRQGVVTADGNVVVRKGVDVLTADSIRVSLTNEEAEARGRVSLSRDDMHWEGGTLRYNFRTRAGDWARVATTSLKPFQMEADRTRREEGGAIAVEGARVTTCTNAPGHWHYHVRAREGEVVPGKSVKAKGAVWYFGSVPVFYFPYWYRDLEDDLGLDLTPGYNSRMGNFLLSSVDYRVASGVKGRSRLDLRSERGVAVGQEFKWRSDRMAREVLGYYADDQDPGVGTDPLVGEIPRHRYRFLLRESHSPSPADTVLAQLEYVSDADMREDFFERDFRRQSEPDNFVSYARWGERYGAGVVLRGRLNDFHDAVNRLPELYLGVPQVPVGLGGLYYESQSAASYMDRVWADGKTNDAYSAFRLDTEHRLSRPLKAFGFLSVTPQAGVRATAYSETWDWRTDSVAATLSETNRVVQGDGRTNVTVTTRQVTNEQVTVSDGGADVRLSAEVGLDVSMKVHRTWNRPGEPLRHLVEPYARYRLRPEPTIEPRRLPQFDATDRLDEEQRLDVGLRNKLQTKRDARPSDIVDCDVFARLRLDEASDVPDTLHVDAEWRPSDLWELKLDSIFDLDAGELDEVNARIGLAGSGPVSASLEYRYRADDSSLLAGWLTVRPVEAWTARLYARYEMEDSRVEEEWVYLQRHYDCMVVRAGVGLEPGYRRTDGSRQDDEWRFIVELWLTAFPKLGLSTARWD